MRARDVKRYYGHPTPRYHRVFGGCLRPREGPPLQAMGQGQRPPDPRPQRPRLHRPPRHPRPQRTGETGSPQHQAPTRETQTHPGIASTLLHQQSP